MLLAVVLAVAAACTGMDADPDGGAKPERDAGVVFDASLRDAGPRDIGPRERPDAGFADPATLLLGEERVRGQRIFMHVRGTTTSTMPPVLFLSTGPLIGFEYLPDLFEFLLGPGGAAAPDRLLVFADLRAVGRSGDGSTDTATVSFETHMLDMQTIMNHVETKFGVSGPWDFVGHGYGSGLAVNYEVLHPDEVNRIVIVGPYATNPTEHADGAGELHNRLTTPERERLMQITMWQNCLRDLGRCSLALWEVWGPHLFCPENFELFDQLNVQYADVRPIAIFVLPRLRAEEYDWVPVLQQVSAETTIIFGVCEPTPVVTFDNYRNNIPNNEAYVFEASGHFPMLEEPDRFQAIVKRALTYP
jgi:pimeloyl-ACP methyl ester carboxylesterase